MTRKQRQLFTISNFDEVIILDNIDDSTFADSNILITNDTNRNEEVVIIFQSDYFRKKVFGNSTKSELLVGAADTVCKMAKNIKRYVGPTLTIKNANGIFKRFYFRA